MVIAETVEENVGVLTFTDLKPLLEGKKHILIMGKTGSGKTSLQFYMFKELLFPYGYRILHRDDGGLQFKYLMPYYPTTIFIPEGCSLEITAPFKLDYEIRTFDYKKPEQIIIPVLKGDVNPLTAIVFDVFCLSEELIAKFYRNLFSKLILYCMRTPEQDKERIIFSIDELNDIIQPTRQSLTEHHKKVESEIAFNIRKLRKHRVILLATSHRPNDLPKHVRTQFDYYIVKKSYAGDMVQFLKEAFGFFSDKATITAKHIQSLDVNEAFIFDYAGNFDKITYYDTLKGKGKEIRIEVEGIIQKPEKELEKKFDVFDLLIVAHRVKNPPTSFREISKRYGFSPDTSYKRYLRLLEVHDDLGKMLEATRYALPSRYRKQLERQGKVKQNA